MKKLNMREKIGIILIALSIISIFFKISETEETISDYGGYAASIGAVLWYTGWKKGRKGKNR